MRLFKELSTTEKMLIVHDLPAELPFKIRTMGKIHKHKENPNKTRQKPFTMIFWINKYNIIINIYFDFCDIVKVTVVTQIKLLFV